LNFLLILVAFVLLMLAHSRAITRHNFLSWTIVLVLFDLLTASNGTTPFVKAADIYPNAPVFEFLRKHANPWWRVASVDGSYGSNFEVPYGLSTATGYDFPTKRIAKFLSTFSDHPVVISFRSDRIIDASKGALDLTGSRFLIATASSAGAARLAALPHRFRMVFQSGSSQIFENPDAVPLASFLPSTAIRVVESDESQLPAILAPDFDARRVVILPHRVDSFPGIPGGASATVVDGLHVDLNEIRMKVGAEQDGLVVLNETYYPGWTAEVDGTAATVIRANYAFMAVPVTAGYHTIRFRFEPAVVWEGGILSAVGCLIAAGLLLFPVPRREQ
jgi:hypothetical protein